MSFDYQRFHSTQREVGEVQAIPISISPVGRDRDRDRVRERNDRERNDISPRTIVSSLSEVPSIETDEDGNGPGGEGATTNSLTESLFSILAFSDYDDSRRNRVCSWRYLKCLFFSCFVTWLVLSLFYSLTYSFRDSLHNTSGVFEATKPFLRSFVHSI